MAVVKQIERIVKREGKVLTVDATDNVATAAQRMRDNKVGCLVVLDLSGKIIGIVTERDILGKVVATCASPALTKVTAVMTPKVIACGWDTTITKAQQIMAGNGIRHLPIVDDGVLVGMISSRDILAHQLSAARAIVREQSKFIQELEMEYPGITSIRKDHSGRVVI
jgi:CBS domain-containing protein